MAASPWWAPSNSNRRLWVIMCVCVWVWVGEWVGACMCVVWQICDVTHLRVRRVCVTRCALSPSNRRPCEIVCLCVCVCVVCVCVRVCVRVIMQMCAWNDSCTCVTLVVSLRWVPSHSNRRLYVIMCVVLCASVRLCRSAYMWRGSFACVMWHGCIPMMSPVASQSLHVWRL